MSVLRSQNGWPVLDKPETTVFSAGGRDWRMAKGLPSAVFSRFITRYAAEVEPIVGGQLDDWSWAKRLVRDSKTVISNHASGTAIDINALDHVRGVRHTFDAGQVQALDRLLRDFPVIRWGGAFGTVVDEMHFELCVSLADLARWATSSTLAEQILGGGITYHPHQEVDVPLTPADLDAVADRVWNRMLVKVRHPRNGEENTISMATALGRAASVIYDGRGASVMLTPEQLIDTVWNRPTVGVQHPLDGHEQDITMAMAVGRAASVIQDGIDAGVLYPAGSPISAGTERVTVDDAGEHDARAGAPDWETPLRELHTLLSHVAGALSDPVTVPLALPPSADATTAPTTQQLAPQDLWRETLARSVQMTGLITGLSKAVQILAAANAKGRTVTAVALHDAVVDAISETVPGVLPTTVRVTTETPA